ncbi:uncharacterized protein [Chelonus insularis]|uniref:uncharacterized protein n=1 Tax=Chelonus insularis TaxID=460826 RepID=UPI00158C7042|nr:uncharacterized protein LOC118070364 [Chelonus insularis]
MNFTSNQEIDTYFAHNFFTDLVGYVDNIESIVNIGPNNKKLYRIIMNNGSNRRVRVLFWDDHALIWHSEITMNTVINITHAYASLINQVYVNPANGLAPIELKITDKSRIILGPIHPM